MSSNYIIKIKDSMAYLKTVEQNNFIYTFSIEEAKRYTKKGAEKLKKEIREFEIVNYEEELYNSKDEKFNILVETIAKNVEPIEKNDLIDFMFNRKVEGFDSYIELQQDYPNNRLISEITRTINAIKNELIVFDYESKRKIMRDKNCTTKFDFTKEKTEQYKKSKIFLEKMRDLYKYDYDYNKQFQILDKKFKEKYISEEVYQEFCVEYKKAYEEEVGEEFDEEIFDE